MQHTEVTSSNLKSYAYDAAFQVLEIRFKKKDGSPGGLYQYEGFPMEALERFMASPSKGRHFAQFIKGRYPTRKLE